MQSPAGSRESAQNGLPGQTLRLPHLRHPLQPWFKGRHNRYRSELAATSMSFRVITRLGLHVRPSYADRFLSSEEEYRNRHTPTEGIRTWNDLPLHDVDPFRDLL